MFWIILILFSLVTSPTLTRVTPNEESTCSRGLNGVEQFQCEDESACVDLSRICDGYKDCEDGSDECSCHLVNGANDLSLQNPILRRRKRQSRCRKNQWQCRDGSCISFDGKCDGVVDCPDRSDETHPLCRKMPCQANWFRCTYGACVDGTAPCNGVSECADNSDELLPRCKNLTMEVKGRFKCDDGSWISATDHCDGNPDCPDGSDETVAVCADKVCPSYLFQCAYGACVDQGADCNGIRECADGSDESDELCNRIASPTTGKPTTVTPTPPQEGACVLPEYPKHGTYTVSNVPNAGPGQSMETFVLSVSCQRGYGILDSDGGMDANGTQQIYCINGVMYQNMPKCVRFCRLDPDPSVTYMCLIPETNGFKTCQKYVAPGISVNPICNSPNYYSSEFLKYMKCISGSWDYVAQCKPGLVKNGTNITIIVKDKVEVFISDFTYGGDNSDNLTVNISGINVNGNNVNNDKLTIDFNNNKIETTVNPVDDEISEDDWRIGPIQTKNKSNVNFNIYNSSVLVQTSDKIYFRN